MNKNGTVIRLLMGLVFTVLIGLSSWNLKETYGNARELSSVGQIVVVGKAERLRQEQQNTVQHQAIIEELKNLVPRQEYSLRSTALELRMKEIELQIKELQVRITALELQIAEVKGKVK